MILYAYSMVAAALSPLVRHWLQKRMRKGKEDAARLEERFGYASLPRPEGKVVWVHAASVGETQSVLGLIRALVQQDPHAHVLLTTGTVTSAALVAQQAIPNLIHQFVPVDTPASVHRFMNHWRPDLALWVESEFWPQLLMQAKRRGIPMLLINARMSERSYRGWAKWPRTVRTILSSFSAIYAGASEDAARLRALGAEVVEAGNLKYDAPTLPVDAQALTLLTNQIADRPLWLAASTHPQEEALVASVHRQLLRTFPRLLTLIVPRHAVRGQAIAEALTADGFRVVQRSKGEAIDDTVGIYLADTMGELGSFYHLSPIVFLGGSLVAHGGHNPLEPARQHCAILSGRHVHNFASIMQQMQQAEAIRLVNDTEDLAAQLVTWLTHPETASTIAENAYALVQQSRGATQTILARVETMLRGDA